VHSWCCGGPRCSDSIDGTVACIRKSIVQRRGLPVSRGNLLLAGDRESLSCRCSSSNHLERHHSYTRATGDCWRGVTMAWFTDRDAVSRSVSFKDHPPFRTRPTAVPIGLRLYGPRSEYRGNLLSAFWRSRPLEQS